MNARIDLAISAGLAEDPIADSRPSESIGRLPERLLLQLSAMFAPPPAQRLQHCDCPGNAHN